MLADEAAKLHEETGLAVSRPSAGNDNGYGNLELSNAAEITLRELAH